MIKSEDKVLASFLQNFIAKNHARLLELILLLNKALAADLLFLAGFDSEKNIALTSLVLRSGVITDNFCYPLSGSPCERVLEDNICLITENLSKKFPDDFLLQQMQVDAYMGLPIRLGNHTVGLLVAMNHSDSTLFQSNQFVAEMFVAQLNASLTAEQQSHQLIHYQQLFDEVCAMSEIGAWEYYIDAKTLYWSDEVYQIYGIPVGTQPTPELGISFYEEADRARISSLFNSAIETGLPYQADFQFTDAVGCKKWVRTSGKVEKGSNSKPLRVYGAIEDVTEERERLQQEQHQRNYLKGVLDSLNDAVITIDETGNIIGCNQTAEVMFGYSAHEFKQLKINALMPEPYASQHDGYMRDFQQTGNAKIMGVGRQLPAKRKTGDVFQMELALSQYKYNKKMNYIGIVRDITKRIEARDTIYRLAFVDSVTGLKNKASFEKELKDLLIRSSVNDSYLYTAFIDIDGLSKYNLAYGFESANHIISVISKRLEDSIGNHFTIYKLGPDEFFVISNYSVPGHNLIDFQYEKFEESLRNPQLYNVQVKEHHLNASISMASMIVPAKKLTLETLVDYLEYGMRQAKRHKPFGYFHLGPTAAAEYERAKLIKHGVQNALKDNEFQIVLQPQYTFENQIFCSEALLRWNSNTLGFISPAEFIPLAEETDDIILIGDWVIEKVCKLLRYLAQSGIKTRIAINISGKQIVQSDFEDKLLAVIEKYSISPDSLMLELTETSLVSDIELVRLKMLSLAKSGFLFSVDDFGTGYSSLTYIKELPLSELKIDKYFVDSIGLEDGIAGTNIVNVIIDMAKTLKLEVVAEGVETQQQYEYLQKRGCDTVQGYFLSKPLSIDDWLVKVGS